MKKTLVAGSAAFFLAAYMLRSSPDTSVTAALNANSGLPSSTNPLAGYRPNLPTARAETLTAQSTKLFKTSTTEKISDIKIGTELGALGVSTDAEGERTGPGAFVYLGKNKKQIAVLDTENHRINVYPSDGSRSPGRSISLPSGMEGIGMAVNSKGELNVVMRHSYDGNEDPDPVYEVRTIDTSSGTAQWMEPKAFRFDGHETHYAAQALRMENIDGKLLITGVHDNEFHSVDLTNTDSSLTEVLPGYPTRAEGKFVRVTANPNAANSMTIQTVQANPNGAKGAADVVNQVQLPENIQRMRNFRVLPSGLLMLDLDPLDRDHQPREVVLYDYNHGKPVMRSRTELPNNSSVNIDQDTYVGRDGLYQLAMTEKNKQKGRFHIRETQFTEE